MYREYNIRFNHLSEYLTWRVDITGQLIFTTMNSDAAETVKSRSTEGRPSFGCFNE